jgi:hypothetical protein
MYYWIDQSNVVHEPTYVCWACPPPGEGLTHGGRARRATQYSIAFALRHAIRPAPSGSGEGAGGLRAQLVATHSYARAQATLAGACVAGAGAPAVAATEVCATGVC